MAKLSILDGQRVQFLQFGQPLQKESVVLLTVGTLVNEQGVDHFRITFKSFLQRLAVPLAQLVIHQSQILLVYFLHDRERQSLVVPGLGDILLLTQENGVEIAQVNTFVGDGFVCSLEVLLLDYLVDLLGEAVVIACARDHVLELHSLDHVLD